MIMIIETIKNNSVNDWSIEGTLARAQIQTAERDLMPWTMDVFFDNPLRKRNFIRINICRK